MHVQYEPQKKTTFFFAEVGGWLAKDFIVLLIAPILTSSFFRARDSVRSSLSASAVLRLIVWKSSSSAPASVPVPAKTMVSVAVNENKFFARLSTTKRKETYAVFVAGNHAQDAMFHCRACSIRHSDIFPYLYFSDKTMRGDPSQSRQSMMRKGVDYQDLWSSCNVPMYVLSSHTYNMIEFKAYMII